MKILFIMLALAFSTNCLADRLECHFPDGKTEVYFGTILQKDRSFTDAWGGDGRPVLTQGGLFIMKLDGKTGDEIAVGVANCILTMHEG